MTAAAGYYRHPTIHGDTVVFVCEDDLWSVDVGGGLARRLTANPGVATFPVFSPDGRWLAFTGRDEGPPEVYVMPADGGPPVRRTWLGSSTQTVGWTPDGTIVFASDASQPFRTAFALHEVAVDEGPSRDLGWGHSRHASWQPGRVGKTTRGKSSGKRGMVLARGAGDPARWKRYRGGTAGTLWIDRDGSGEFEPLIELDGSLADPMWIGSRIYFLSDHEGHGNVYSCTPTGRSLRRHTHHDDFYARFPRTDGRRIVYQAGANLFVLDPREDGSEPIDVRVASARSQRNRRFVSAAKYFEDADLHPDGHSIASVHRGSVYVAGLWDGASRALTGEGSAVRERLARWLPDGKRIAFVSDADGEEHLYVRSADGRGRARRLRVDVGRALSIAVAPAGADRLAITNHRHELIVVDVARGTRRLVERSEYDRIRGVAWSPDGRWLAYGFADGRNTSCIKLYEVARRRTVVVTRSDFRDVRPAFDPEGRYLYFLSWRTFNPVYDSLYFDLGFPKGCRPYLVTLRRDLVSPFDAAAREPRGPGGGNGKTDAGGGKSKRLRIDVDGIEERVVAFPVPEGRYGQIAATEGRVFFTAVEPQGSVESAVSNAGARLLAWDFAQEKLETVQPGARAFALALGRTALAMRVGRKLRVVAPTFKASKDQDNKPSRKSGWVDLERHRVSVVPGDEWRQMFREAWRLQRDHFWTEDMSGVDWKRVLDVYLPLVDRVTTRAEFSDLVWEMQGELGTSHCYEMGGDYLPSPKYHQGFLGADLVWSPRHRGWRVESIPRGDSWIGGARSPLAAPGVSVAKGDVVVAVGGTTVDARTSPSQALVHRAGQAVELRVRAAAARKGGKGGKGARPRERTVSVRALTHERPLRYRDWVERNREAVHRRSRGRVGYVHVPNMGPDGFAEFHRYYAAEFDHDGLVIDVRFNGGGHVSQLLLEKLLRRRVGYDKTRWGQPEAYPSDAPAGPMVAITNEYAGSDGDIFSHCFKLFGLGPLVGKRTWGGVIGIFPRHALVDGTTTTQPEFAFWFEDVGWGVENFGTEPDVDVDVTPQDWRAGRDPQLDRALVEIRRLLREKPPRRPRFGKGPVRRPKGLPRL